MVSSPRPRSLRAPRRDPLPLDRFDAFTRREAARIFTGESAYYAFDETGHLRAKRPVEDINRDLHMQKERERLQYIGDHRSIYEDELEALKGDIVGNQRAVEEQEAQREALSKTSASYYQTLGTRLDEVGISPLTYSCFPDNPAVIAFKEAEENQALLASLEEVKAKNTAINDAIRTAQTAMATHLQRMEEIEDDFRMLDTSKHFVERQQNEKSPWRALLSCVTSMAVNRLAETYGAEALQPGVIGEHMTLQVGAAQNSVGQAIQSQFAPFFSLEPTFGYGSEVESGIQTLQDNLKQLERLRSGARKPPSPHRGEWSGSDIDEHESGWWDERALLSETLEGNQRLVDLAERGGVDMMRFHNVYPEAVNFLRASHEALFLTDSDGGQKEISDVPSFVESYWLNLADTIELTLSPRLLGIMQEKSRAPA